MIECGLIFVVMLAGVGWSDDGSRDTADPLDRLLYAVAAGDEIGDDAAELVMQLTQ